MPIKNVDTPRINLGHFKYPSPSYNIQAENSTDKDMEFTTAMFKRDQFIQALCLRLQIINTKPAFVNVFYSSISDWFDNSEVVCDKYDYQYHGAIITQSILDGSISSLAISAKNGRSYKGLF